MMLRAARRALHATRRQLSTSTDALPKVPKPPTAALAKRSQLLRDVRDQRPFLMKSCRVGVEGRRRAHRASPVAPRSARNISTRSRIWTCCRPRRCAWSSRKANGTSCPSTSTSSASRRRATCSPRASARSRTRTSRATAGRARVDGDALYPRARGVYLVIFVTPIYYTISFDPPW